jgi:hypothetical protein
LFNKSQEIQEFFENPFLIQFKKRFPIFHFSSSEIKAAGEDSQDLRHYWNFIE